MAMLTIGGFSFVASTGHMPGERGWGNPRGDACATAESCCQVRYLTSPLVLPSRYLAMPTGITFTLSGHAHWYYPHGVWPRPLVLYIHVAWQHPLV